jgi:hypothetical protein
MRAAIYARVSTLDQEPENQLLELRRYVQARGWTAAEYVDRGVSGAKDRRAALDQLLTDARRRRLDAVVCWRLDRLGARLASLLHGPAEFLVDDLLDAFEAGTGRQLLVDHLASLLQGDDVRGQAAHPLQALVNGRLADAEVACGLSLRVAGVEVSAEVGVGDFRVNHRVALPEDKLTSA